MILPFIGVFCKQSGWCIDRNFNFIFLSFLAEIYSKKCISKWEIDIRLICKKFNLSDNKSYLTIFRKVDWNFRCMFFIYKNITLKVLVLFIANELLEK